MGNWHISISGVGTHHNQPPHAGDVDLLVRRFVEELIALGQVVTHAALTHGGAEELPANNFTGAIDVRKAVHGTHCVEVTLPNGTRVILTEERLRATFEESSTPPTEPPATT